ncbi:FAD-dependent oxidoreductase [Agromyces ramosus]|uniref:Glycine/D-amino acid oxidase-like deaminating enzyme/nitrite reductase/ring-hydroxylating ferredoxin subunit n=1 Tax=Agromyces ramosus TaxID=33879 RepID=A0ABU0R925_9MICO|nr:FAD-dependent oxidoreductase [Agromyces ramosus]MDQ0894565.1 glycine/D-amino acid oxidase-like deaminating enzyme/nitrite reductase/ring-hydroxylating ferredoxin subunit [Agromyces ramosus]
MTSIWRAAAPASSADGTSEPSFTPSDLRRDRFDVAVVGAGITGLSTALMLAQAGRSVVVVEAREVAALASGGNTGKASVLQGARLQRIRRSHSAKVVQAYVDANLDGQAWIAEFAAEHGVPVERETAYSHAQSDSGLETVRAEYEAAREAGLPVELVEQMPVTFPFAGAVALEGQLALDPYRLVVALARAFVTEGGVLLAGVRVHGVHATDPANVETEHGPIRAGAVVIATAAPILGRGLYFAKTRHSRSYLASFRLDDPPPPGLFLSVDQPTRSVRTAPDDRAPGAPRQLIVGGSEHPVGRVDSTAARADELVDWTRRYFAGAELTHRWSAQDYESLNLVPFAGRMPRGRGRVWFATGYAKWGLTNGVAAALRITAEVLGEPWPEHRAWIRTLGTRTTKPSDLGRGVAENATVAKLLVTGWVRAETNRAPAPRPAEGEGVVLSRGGVPVGVSTVEGRTCAVRAVCTHLGGVLTWNDAESTWDCPLHGSRFEASGRLIEGPATRDLRATVEPDGAL